MKKKLSKRKVSKKSKTNKRSMIFGLVWPFYCFFYYIFRFCFFFVKTKPFVSLIFLVTLIFFVFVTENALFDQEAWHDSEYHLSERGALEQYPSHDKNWQEIRFAQDNSITDQRIDSLTPHAENIVISNQETLDDAHDTKVHSLQEQDQNTALTSKIGRYDQQDSQDGIALLLKDNQQITKQEIVKTQQVSLEPNIAIAPKGDDEVQQLLDSQLKAPLPYEFWHKAVPIPMNNPLKLAPQEKLVVDASFKTNSNLNNKLILVQKALGAFGYENITLSGTYDSVFCDALKDFQDLFSLKVTGRVDKPTLAKMQEIGLLPLH